MFRIEYCTDDVELAIKNAHLYDQLEFCADLGSDGLTPSPFDVEKILDAGICDVKVMIRSRPGNFTYSLAEMDVMKAQVYSFQKIGVKRFVFGAMKNGRLDFETIQSLVGEMDASKMCIHKAIDESSDILADLRLLMGEDLITEVLSSGGARTALEGAEMLHKMVLLSQNKIEIIAAGKVTKSTLEEVHQKIGAPIYHGRNIV